MFWVPKEDFELLCELICNKVGIDKFWPRSYLSDRDRNVGNNAHSNSKVGGLIPSEIKVAITIPIFAGALYLDLAPLFRIVTGHIYKIVEVIHWILVTFEFLLVMWLQDWQ
mmetsp:Transcript_31456/g.48254  ORF Transcript_31456/g.48254 Transcript_31456/m.48254 type:complete len:111 (-) Transcript_31456:898-1230(-)